MAAFETTPEGAITMQAPPDAGLAPCRNCGAVPVAQTPPPAFCARCGQERTLHPPTLVEFLHEFVGHYVALDGPLWRTLALLLARPGRLTREYLDGRRRRYVLPLRLYLSASFLFFVVLKLIPTAVGEANGVPARERVVPAGPVASVPVAAGPVASMPVASAPASGAASGAPRATTTWRFGEVPPPAQISDCGTPGHAACTPIERWVAGLFERARPDPAAFLEHVRGHALAIAPYAIFLLLPLFAAILMLAYRGRRMTYGEHVVFSLHLHAFWFLALLAVAVLPKGLADLVQIAVPVYGVMAQRTVYGGGWFATIARAALVSVLYGTALLVATVGLLVVLLSTA
jgi:hypothetical protein